MRLKIASLATAVVLCAVLLLSLGGAASGARIPRAPAEFFGIGPQTPLTERDAEYMKAGGIGVVRMAVPWSSLQPVEGGGYNWDGFDEGVAVASRAGLKVLPFLYGTPHWLARKPTTLPIDNGKERREWTAFLKAAVERYGPRGQFWSEHGPGSAAPVPKRPIRIWQVWNEANFFYFAYPASPSRYAKLVKISSRAIRSADHGAKVILSGLFAKPTAKGARGMPAARFLKQMYRVKGTKGSFDGISLHPYAINTRILKRYVEEFHDVAVQNHDRVGLYITEMGWGSQPDFRKVAFEQGPQGQVRQLRGAYTFLLDNRRRLDVKQVHWFSWKDIQGDCNFCDSVGLFHEGAGFRPKPAWRAFVKLSHGRLKP